MGKRVVVVVELKMRMWFATRGLRSVMGAGLDLHVKVWCYQRVYYKVAHCSR